MKQFYISALLYVCARRTCAHTPHSASFYVCAHFLFQVIKCDFCLHLGDFTAMEAVLFASAIALLRYDVSAGDDLARIYYQ